jgi:hypothetical protein
MQVTRHGSAIVHEHRAARGITAFLNRENPAIRCSNGSFHVSSHASQGSTCANRLAEEPAKRPRELTKRGQYGRNDFRGAQFASRQRDQ